MNPARSLGPAIAYTIFGGSTDGWHYHFVYWVGPVAGSAVAAALYKYGYVVGHLLRLQFTSLDQAVGSWHS